MTYEYGIQEVDWSPERKIVAAAAAVVLIFLVQLIFQLEVPVGIEGAIAVLVGYWVPNSR